MSTNTKIRFMRKQKQQIVDEYLSETGKNFVDPADFVAYVQSRDDHPMHHMLFGKSDSELAEARRIDIVRNFMAGLRTTVVVTVREQASSEPKPSTVRIAETRQEAISVPSYISPMDSRKLGGGYVRLDIESGDHKRELAGQAARDLNAWIKRYGGLCRMLNLDLAAVTSLAEAIEDQSVVESQA